MGSLLVFIVNAAAANLTPMNTDSATQEIGKIAGIAKQSKIENHRCQTPFSAIFGSFGISGNR